MLKLTLQNNLRNILSDDGYVMTDSELAQIIDLAILEYSMLRPAVSTISVSALAGTLTYALPSTVIVVYDTLNVSNVSTAYVQNGQNLVFDLDPGTGTYSVLVGSVHLENPSGTYATIPDFELRILVDISSAIMLERVADDIVRRPDIQDGQTRESWRNSAELLYKRALIIRDRVNMIAGNDYSFVG